MGSVSALSSVRVIEAWVGAYLECVEGLFSSVVTDIKAGSVQASSLHYIPLMMSLSSSDSTTFKTLRKAVMEHSGRLREKLSKFVRGCLKHGLHNQDVITL